MAKRDDETTKIETEETRHPMEWARELGTAQHVYAGAAMLGAHRWIQGVAVTQAEYQATLDDFLNIQIGA